MMDLAALRVRDTIKNLGDLAEIAQLYSEATGEAVDHDVVDYHTVLYNALTVLSAAPPLAAPMRSTDLMSHMAWYVNSARWALEVMADMLGLELEPIEELSTTSSGHGAAYAHLAAGLRARTAETSADYELSSLQRVARHLVRIDEVGAASREADLDELADALGYRPDPGDVNAALVDLVQRSDSAADPLLVRLFDRRMQRAHALMGPPGSLMLRHPRLRSLRPGDETDAGSTWPPGLIPGTR
jgi:hypothetical protein